VFLQILERTEVDLEIPDRPFTFGQLIQAQAAGDAAVLAEHGRPVVTLTITESSDDVLALFEAAQK
jgi:glucose-6-phosphate isomerase